MRKIKTRDKKKVIKDNFQLEREARYDFFTLVILILNLST
jgi:hypothetical protein